MSSSPSPKRRGFARSALAALAAPVISVLMIHLAVAQTRVDYLAEQLRSASDFRVRVQAALALGASNNNAAVRPLCTGLEDANPTVRSSVAAALGRLGMPSGVPCLKRQLETEKSAAVKSQLERSLAQIGGGDGGGQGRAPDKTSKWYVSVATTRSTGDRSGQELDPIVQAAMRESLGAKSGFAFAPRNETSAQANAVMSRFKLRGYQLQTTVEPPKYEGGKLTVVIRVTMFTYPGKAFQGEFAPKLTQADTPSKDTASEDVLIKMAVARAMDRFATVCETSR